MEQIVDTRPGRDNQEYEPNFSEEKFSSTKPDAFTGSFTVKNVEPGDKGLYFCAVSQHSDTGDWDSCTNTNWCWMN